MVLNFVKNESTIRPALKIKFFFKFQEILRQKDCLKSSNCKSFGLCFTSSVMKFKHVA